MPKERKLEVQLLGLQQNIPVETNATPQPPVEVVQPEYTPDTQVYYSQKLLSDALQLKANLPLEEVNELAQQYQIDPVYASARYILETGWGKSELWQQYNNPAGIKCGEKYCHYETKEEGLQAMFTIMNAYLQKGLTTVVEQSSLWSESEDTTKVIRLMNEIKEMHENEK